jgi:uncharacterized protein DUF3795
MKKERIHTAKSDKRLAAVCGLYCEACTLYIATTEDPQRLKLLADRFGISEEDIKCYGCRSAKRGPYCAVCKMYTCAAEKGIEFCSGCDDYPCGILQKFQSEAPHRIELWDSLDNIRDGGYKNWLREMKVRYSCSECGAINSAYDMKCRNCGNEPSCSFTAEHRKAIEPFLKNLISS